MSCQLRNAVRVGNERLTRTAPKVENMNRCTDAGNGITGEVAVVKSGLYVCVNVTHGGAVQTETNACSLKHTSINTFCR